MRALHDLAALDFDDDGRAGISLFRSELVTLPLELALMERHPDGSQAFLPMCWSRFLVVVAADEGGRPGLPLAFVTGRGQAVNIGRNIWHGVLSPFEGTGMFAVVDRIGPGANLEEFRFGEPWVVTLAGQSV